MPQQIPFSTCSWDCSTWLHEEGLPSPWDHTHSLKDWSYFYQSTHDWSPKFSPILSWTWWRKTFRVITQQYASSSRNPQFEDTRANEFPAGTFCSTLQQLHDNHRFFTDPFRALAEFKVFLHKAKKMTKRELSKQTPDCIGTKHWITSTALRANRNRHLGTLMRCCEAWNPVDHCFETFSFELQIEYYLIWCAVLRCTLAVWDNFDWQLKTLHSLSRAPVSCHNARGTRTSWCLCRSLRRRHRLPCRSSLPPPSTLCAIPQLSRSRIRESLRLTCTFPAPRSGRSLPDANFFALPGMSSIG